MGYAVESALFQWDEGERRIGILDEHRPVVEAVTAEIRRRLGSTFTLEELADLYGAGTDWAADIAASLGAGPYAAWAVQAAFRSYSREAADYAGGRRLPSA